MVIKLQSVLEKSGGSRFRMFVLNPPTCLKTPRSERKKPICYNQLKNHIGFLEMKSLTVKCKVNFYVCPLYVLCQIPENTH